MGRAFQAAGAASECKSPPAKGTKILSREERGLGTEEQRARGEQSRERGVSSMRGEQRGSRVRPPQTSQ